MSGPSLTANTVYPRVAITYCTQCRWMLRAAYFGQELLSTFGTSIGEIALIPATGGIFTVHLTFKTGQNEEPATILIWDRKTEGGFPETKILKQKIRNQIEPEKNLGHSDTPSSKASVSNVNDSTAKTEEHLEPIQKPNDPAPDRRPSADPRLNDPLVLSANATPIKEKTFNFPVTPPRQTPAKKDEKDVHDPLLSEALSANMSPSDPKQAEYAFMVATQDRNSSPPQNLVTTESAPRKVTEKSKEPPVIDEALERLKRDVAAAAPPNYKQHCEDCN